MISAESHVFEIFNATRAVLETLPSQVHLVALLSQRAAVKSRLTQQRFVLWSRRLHELANPWKRFKSLVIFGINVSRNFEPSFPLPCCLVFRLCERRCFGPDPARNIDAQIEKCNQVL